MINDTESAKDLYDFITDYKEKIAKLFNNSTQSFNLWIQLFSIIYDKLRKQQHQQLQILANRLCKIVITKTNRTKYISIL